MSVMLPDMLLWWTVLWPLLLAVPLVHRRMPGCRYWALAPAVVLLAWPGPAMLELPWLLLGSNLVLTDAARWPLAMVAAIWLLAAASLGPARQTPGDGAVTVLWLLSLAGALGVVLAGDLVVFFGAGTLMGYAFYGLVVLDTTPAARRAGRWYLYCLVAADLLLFEALLLAGSVTTDLRFAVVGQGDSGPAYVWIVLLAFALKAGLWPVHGWVALVYPSAARVATIVLAGVLALAWFGLWRWLPVGAQAWFATGITLLLIGAIACFYGVWRIRSSGAARTLPVGVALAAGGLWLAVVAGALAYPAAWQPYAGLVTPLMAAAGLALAVLGWVCGARPAMERTPSSAGQRLEFWGRRLVAVGRDMQVRWRVLRSSARQMISGRGQSPALRKPVWGSGWGAAVLAFVLLAISLAGLAVLLNS